MINPFTQGTVKKLIEAKTPADLFAELFLLFDESNFDAHIQKLHSERWADLIQETFSCREDLRESPDLREVSHRMKGRIAALPGAKPEDAILRAAAMLCGIDESFVGVGVFPSEVPQVDLRWTAQSLRLRGRLNESTAGKVLPKGSRIEERTLLGLLRNLTYIPESRQVLAIDYGVLRARAHPMKSVRHPMTVGFLPVAVHAKDLKLEFKKSSGKTSYGVSTRDTELDEIIDRILKQLDLLYSHGCTVVLLPELCLHERILEEISNWSKSAKKRWRGVDPPLILAGSKATAGSGGSFANRAFMIGSDGELAWTQDKLNPYDIPYRTAKFWGIEKDLDLDVGETAFEGTSPEHSKLVVRDSTFGRLAILICQDFSVDKRIRPLLEYLGPTHLFVPILDSPFVELVGKVTRWTVMEGSHLKARGMTSLVANSLWVRARQQEKGNLGTALLYGLVLAPPRRIPGLGSHSGYKEVITDCPHGPFGMWDEGMECT